MSKDKDSKGSSKGSDTKKDGYSAKPDINKGKVPSLQNPPAPPPPKKK